MVRASAAVVASVARCSSAMCRLRAWICWNKQAVLGYHGAQKNKTKTTQKVCASSTVPGSTGSAPRHQPAGCALPQRLPHAGVRMWPPAACPRRSWQSLEPRRAFRCCIADSVLLQQTCAYGLLHTVAAKTRARAGIPVAPRDALQPSTRHCRAQLRKPPTPA